MTNNLVLPLLALVLAVLAAFFPSWREDLPAPQFRQRLSDVRSGSIVTAIVILLFGIAVTEWPQTFVNGGWIASAFAIGALVGVLASTGDTGRDGFAVGMAVVGASVLHLLPAAMIASDQVAFVAGAFVAAFATNGLEGEGLSGYLCAFTALFIVAADFLGRVKVGSDPSSMAGDALGVAFLVSALIAGVLARFGQNAVVRGGIGFVSLILVGYVGCLKYLGDGELGMLWVGGVAIGGIVHLILAGEAKSEPFRFILATVIWLGAATVAFGMGHLAYGMAITLLGGATMLTLLGDVRGLMTISVPASILVYRLFRESYPDEARAPDIGQHYTMIGIAIGALLPLLPLEWARDKAGPRTSPGPRTSSAQGRLGLPSDDPADATIQGWRAGLATGVWILILLGLPVAAAVLLGSKGAIGMVVGLGFAAVVEGLRGSVSLAPAGIATGLGCATVFVYGRLGDWTDLERAVKVKAVITVAIVALILAAALFGLARPAARSKE